MTRHPRFTRRSDSSDSIAKLEARVVKVFSLVGFLVILADTAITHIYPHLKHIWHVIFGP